MRALEREVDALKTSVAKLKKKVAKAAPSEAAAISTVSKGAKGAPTDIDNPGVVVDVPYSAGEFLPLPVDFLRRDSSGKG